MNFEELLVEQKKIPNVCCSNDWSLPRSLFFSALLKTVLIGFIFPFWWS